LHQRNGYLVTEFLFISDDEAAIATNRRLLNSSAKMPGIHIMHAFEKEIDERNGKAWPKQWMKVGTAACMIRFQSYSVWKLAKDF